MNEVVITAENFESQVINSPKPVLLDFWATWCGPCRMIAPFVEQIAEERSDIVVGKIDVDDQRELAIQFKIASIPTLIVMKGGEVHRKAIGYMQKDEILKLLED